MEDQHLLEQWTEQELGSMEVDEVFAPYIIRMIDLSQDLVQLHESIVEVLMGWCAQEHEDQANQFTSNLLRYAQHPDQFLQETIQPPSNHHHHHHIPYDYLTSSSSSSGAAASAVTSLMGTTTTTSSTSDTVSSTTTSSSVYFDPHSHPHHSHVDYSNSDRLMASLSHDVALGSIQDEYVPTFTSPPPHPHHHAHLHHPHPNQQFPSSTHEYHEYHQQSKSSSASYHHHHAQTSPPSMMMNHPLANNNFMNPNFITASAADLKLRPTAASFVPGYSSPDIQPHHHANVNTNNTISSIPPPPPLPNGLFNDDRRRVFYHQHQHLLLPHHRRSSSKILTPTSPTLSSVPLTEDQDDPCSEPSPPGSGSRNSASAGSRSQFEDASSYVHPTHHLSNGEQDQDELNLHELDLIFEQEEEEQFEEQAFVWSVAHELIEQLTWRFPECHPASLLEILKTVEMNINLASNILKNILEKEQNGVTQVCRHYLQGECRRADCMFLHDTHEITCRFWIRGSCAQTEQCIFLHGVVLTPDNVNYVGDCSDSEEEDDEEPPDLTSEDKFPALGGSTSSTSGGNSTTGTTGTSSSLGGSSTKKEKKYHHSSATRLFNVMNQHEAHGPLDYHSKSHEKIDLISGSENTSDWLCQNFAKSVTLHPTKVSSAEKHTLLPFSSSSSLFKSLLSPGSGDSNPQMQQNPSHDNGLKNSSSHGEDDLDDDHESEADIRRRRFEFSQYLREMTIKTPFGALTWSRSSLTPLSLNAEEDVKLQCKLLRTEASRFAAARNDCFMKASMIYPQGQKTMANELSAKGRIYNERMKECHFQVAIELFKHHNSPKQIYEDHLLDLHGLHLAEAVEFLTEMFPQLSQEGILSLRVVTGSGHYQPPTQGGKSRLRAAVERFLHTEGYSYSAIADHQDYVGIFLVNLQLVPW